MKAGVPQDPFPMCKVMLTLTCGLVVIGVMIWGLLGWEDVCVWILGCGAADSMLECKVMGSDRTDNGLSRAKVECKGLMDSWLLQPSVLVKVSVLVVQWLWSLLASPFSSRHSFSCDATLNKVSWVFPVYFCREEEKEKFISSGFKKKSQTLSYSAIKTTFMVPVKLSFYLCFYWMSHCGYS